jgi:leucyl/phenylalanyl-tRNA--protein transferase
MLNSRLKRHRAAFRRRGQAAAALEPRDSSANFGGMAPLDPDLLLRAYTIGVFPMAESRTAPDVYWVEPKRRGVLPLEAFHLSRSLAKTLRADRFTVTCDQAFAEVISACAEPVPGRPDSWISPQIEKAYGILHRRGNAHSIECWHDGALVGGLYGVKLGAAFFGESMFTRMRDASKVALAWLVARMQAGRFRLLDTQFLTDHLASLGAVAIDREVYRVLLDGALAPDAAAGADFFALDRLPSPSDDAAMVSGPLSGMVIAQLLTQTS